MISYITIDILIVLLFKAEKQGLLPEVEGKRKIPSKMVSWEVGWISPWLIVIRVKN